MTFHILSVFPKVFDEYFQSSVLGRARRKGIIKIKSYNLRDWAADKRRTIDDRPFGGGPGMVLGIAPIYKGVESIKYKASGAKSRSERSSTTGIKSKKLKVRTILFSTRGKKFDSKTAKRLSKYNHLILICGRYEGVDERVAQYIADEEISVGDFVLSGGEIPAMIVVDAVSRMIKGVLGKNESLEEKKGSYPVYTRPEIFFPNRKNKKKAWKVPQVLLSGNHKKIEEWRKNNE
ncbi:MAG: tRNA (guanine-N(1)-)-methyltransferase, tRNA (guanine-N1-)-methyltransferase [Candidatus Wolfebacteria bacterium GW2011_GWC1_43_10]|uniref:tRNA (guanine-N(1)-)-methyltransferase n=2 Tax=Candidatus Wolfeibacteriota TaxID=1752735 RepID=A0A0G1EIL5_9BACT|nr:MAG: tRNA (guanine-N(1)-)-methyltransferase, tRNA (guanine-N1-)-methyltransferase [Candidatus Wolfebacteria bacterium GW2011_GWC1_43_10]KKT22774.1 MAG: tRNA (guanine-N(1)-)-methyltransferase [Parcubacteria group bacterium GW2011_GWB1_43_8b]OGM89673.1 MAG: tRNA (guanosine(37)-N1)-methyltransferase TrmD [Candidatus Wolfebacteria bacterium GWA1_42_9]